MALDTKTHKIYLSAAQLGPAPEATADNPHPRPKIAPGSFHVLVVSPDLAAESVEKGATASH
jgi:hypothetical protein